MDLKKYRQFCFCLIYFQYYFLVKSSWMIGVPKKSLKWKKQGLHSKTWKWEPYKPNFQFLGWKFDMSLLDGNLGFIALAKTKIDQTFPTARFTKTGYKKTYRLDITSKKGDSYLMLKHIPSKQVISPELPSERLSINAVIHESMFPESLRYADITSTFKKENEIGKAIYRSTCLFPSISKILEKVRYV